MKTKLGIGLAIVLAVQAVFAGGVTSTGKVMGDSGSFGDDVILLNEDGSASFASGLVSINLDGTVKCVGLNDGAAVLAVDPAARTLHDAAGVLSVDWANRKIYKSDGTTVAFDWENDTPATAGTMLLLDQSVPQHVTGGTPAYEAGIDGNGPWAVHTDGSAYFLNVMCAANTHVILDLTDGTGSLNDAAGAVLVDLAAGASAVMGGTQKVLDLTTGAEKVNMANGDVAVDLANRAFYLKGDASTDGSWRQMYDSGVDGVVIQTRVSGVWQTASTTTYVP